MVVLGDIGRSPRMCYHALSLAENGYEVKLYLTVDILFNYIIVSSIQVEHFSQNKILIHFSMFYSSSILHQRIPDKFEPKLKLTNIQFL